ncbi:hypothetical protein LX73_1980 [Fodinibius salinus]|uniref:Uncharacterized protein n=1 Tax=Fodinibius salinus TaxID=860790 RepID=A0A5D3YL34_9BACT|nr:hypothetical protein [Fodinibius salinus]TYP92618.1 hypothetical protein LX73_1980 [Fodinibius salinus]
MSNDSRSERERLKEKYKTHYRKMRETKKRVSRAKKTQNIAEALKSMDKRKMLDTFDDFLFSVKHKVAQVEARLDVAMEGLSDDIDAEAQKQEFDEEMKREQAKETLRKVKMEMGLLYEELKEQADSLKVEKTVGNKSDGSSNDPATRPEHK